MARLFGTDGVRGIANEELTPQLIKLIDETKHNDSLTEAQKQDEITLHMMGYTKACTNEIIIEVLGQILNLEDKVSDELKNISQATIKDIVDETMNEYAKLSDVEELIFASDSFYRDHTLHCIWVYFLGEYLKRRKVSPLAHKNKKSEIAAPPK